MLISASRFAASSSVLLGAACLVLAQEPPPLPLGSDNYVPAAVPSMHDKDAALLATPPSNPPPHDVRQWDGDKPFIPEMHAGEAQPVNLSAPARQYADQMLDAFAPAAAAAFNLRQAHVDQVRITPLNDGRDLVIWLRLGDEDHVIHLQPFTMRAPDAQLLVQDETGFLNAAEWPEPLTWRGVVATMADTDVAATVDGDRVWMLILPRDAHLTGAASWHVQPLDDALPGVPGDLHVVYRSSDRLPTGARCGVGANRPNAGAVQPLAERVFQHAGSPLAARSDKAEADGDGFSRDSGSLAAVNQRCQVAFDADFEYFQANGSSTPATVADIERIMNQVGLIYQSQVAISYYTMATIVRTAEPDPYSSTNEDTLLCQFRAEWNSNFILILIQRDVAHLFTGKEIDGTTVGLAWPGVVCNVQISNCSANGSGAYGFSQSRFSTTMADRVQLTAHELGHNWNACHCNQQACTGSTTPDSDCGIMWASINGSLTFGNRSRNAIIAHRDSRTCLDNWQNPVYVNHAWGGSQTGSAANPFQRIDTGVNAALVGGEVWAASGNYLYNFNINKIVTIKTTGGTVRIGN